MFCVVLVCRLAVSECWAGVCVRVCVVVILVIVDCYLNCVVILRRYFGCCVSAALVFCVVLVYRLAVFECWAGVFEEVFWVLC